MERREFAKQYKEKVEPIDIRKYQQQQTRQAERRTRQQDPVRYKAPKGTAHRAQKRKRKPNTRLAALILAAAIGVGGITLINNHSTNQQEQTNIIEMQQEGVNLQKLGLSEETIELFEKYDEYFENFDEKKQYDLTDDQILDMISEIRGMHFSTVKEKMGNLIGEDPKNIKMYYSFDDADGKQHTSIIVNEDSYNKESYTNDSGLFSKKNQIPKELSNVIWQLEDLDNLQSDLKIDKITKVNAIKKLEKLYGELEQVATGDFIKDEKGNISIIQYEDNQTAQEKEDKERD